MNDGELMRRVQAGDEPAFAALMETWELPLKRLLGRLVQNSAEAEDLAQESFVRVWQERSRFRDGAEFRPWLFAIGINLARNRMRWWRRRPAVSLEAWSSTGAGIEAADPAQGPARAAEAQERAEEVRRAVGDLPAKLREVVILFEFEQLNYAETANVLGCSTKAVETRLYRAREILRTSIRGETFNA